MSLPAPSKLIKGRDTEKYITKHFPDLYNYLIYHKNFHSKKEFSGIKMD